MTRMIWDGCFKWDVKTGIYYRDLPFHSYFCKSTALTGILCEDSESVYTQHTKSEKSDGYIYKLII